MPEQQPPRNYDLFILREPRLRVFEPELIYSKRVAMVDVIQGSFGASFIRLFFQLCLSFSPMCEEESLVCFSAFEAHTIDVTLSVPWALRI